MMASGDVIAIPLAERLREKARAARMAAIAPPGADNAKPAVAIAPLVADGAVAFAVAGAAHRGTHLMSSSCRMLPCRCKGYALATHERWPYVLSP